jgi:hypothetical protein
MTEVSFFPEETDTYEKDYMSALCLFALNPIHLNIYLFPDGQISDINLTIENSTPPII